MPAGDIFDLTTRFLEEGVAPLYNGTTSVEPLVDGVSYFTKLFQAIDSTAASTDFVYLTNWTLDDSMKGPGLVEIGDLLAIKANMGVDVRLILSGGVYYQYNKKAGPFHDNLVAARRLREIRINNQTPLSGRVLLDWSGQKRSGSHHQKSAVVRTQSGIQAFVSGLDLVPSRYDSRPHQNLSWGLSVSPWGWHDIGVRLRGKAVAQVWENFRSRWQEAMTLPDLSYDYDFEYKLFPVAHITSKTAKMNPRPLKSTPSPSPQINAVVSNALAVQVLRSRYPYKRFPARWSEAPTGGLREIVSVLKKAIGAAQRYIYIEDQYLKDSVTFEFIGDEYSLFPSLLAAAKRDVKLILVGSDISDPTDVYPAAGPRNQWIEDAGDVKAKLIDPLAQKGKEKNVVVWRVKNTTVHAKLMIVDDLFASIGSANMHSRSMFGVDSELQVAFVDANASPNSVVQNLRIDLWAEHLRLTSNSQTALRPQLEDLTVAFGIWRTSWLSQNIDKKTWRTMNYPTGFNPSDSALEPVVPGD